MLVEGPHKDSNTNNTKKTISAVNNNNVYVYRCDIIKMSMGFTKITWSIHYAVKPQDGREKTGKRQKPKPNQKLNRFNITVGPVWSPEQANAV